MLIIKDENSNAVQLEDQNILNLNLNNAAYVHRNIWIVPQWKWDDGLSHLTINDDRTGTFGALRLLLEIENNPFFRKNEEESDETNIVYEPASFNLFDYYKGSEFRIEPDADFIKRTQDPEENIKYGKYSIDGEGYSVDNLSCKVLPKVIEIFW